MFKYYIFLLNRIIKTIILVPFNLLKYIIQYYWREDRDNFLYVTSTVFTLSTFAYCFYVMGIWADVLSDVSFFFSSCVWEILDNFDSFKYMIEEITSNLKAPQIIYFPLNTLINTIETYILNDIIVNFIFLIFFSMLCCVFIHEFINLNYFLINSLFFKNNLNFIVSKIYKFKKNKLNF